MLQNISCASPVAASTATRTLGRSATWARFARSEEHTSELQSQSNLVCRLLLEKKKQCRVFILVIVPASADQDQLAVEDRAGDLESAEVDALVCFLRTIVRALTVHVLDASVVVPCLL